MCVCIWGLLHIIESGILNCVDPFYNMLAESFKNITWDHYIWYLHLNFMMRRALYFLDKLFLKQLEKEI